MRPSQKSNRNRGKSGNRPKGGVGNVINRVFDSTGPEGKVRGTPQQIIDKYEQLARDAQTSGDRVTAENFLQHAEHYLRLLSAAQAEQAAHQQAQQLQQQQRREQEQQRRHDDGGRQSGQGGGHGGGPAMNGQPEAGGGALDVVEPDSHPGSSGPLCPRIQMVVLRFWW